MKRLLIVCPYFPPVNAADMQRVRMSLPYYEQFGWIPEVVTVDNAYSDLAEDDLLTRSLPGHITIHRVKALPKEITSRFGLGSIALRSLWYYRWRVNRLLQTTRYDLIFFSTTQFPLCILGPYWKKRFNVPYLIDLQDPWLTEYYRDKPRHQRPPKYWFSYRLNKFTEAIAMQKVGGLMSVSQQYINEVKQRYPAIAGVPERVITFGSSDNDFKLAASMRSGQASLLRPGCKNLVYIGRGGADMHKAAHALFHAMRTGLDEQPEIFGKLHLTFIGTSYAPNGQGKPAFIPLAASYGLQEQVTELTDRISYYHTLNTLLESDALLILGSDAQGYTASKLYPYLSSQKPLLAIMDENSPAVSVLREFGAEQVYSFHNPQRSTGIYNCLLQVAAGTLVTGRYNAEALHKYSAEQLTAQQCQLFNQVIPQN